MTMQFQFQVMAKTATKAMDDTHGKDPPFLSHNAKMQEYKYK